MRILAIETSGPRGGIALAEDSANPAAPVRILEETFLGEGLRHGRDLVLIIRDACDRAGWDRRTIPAVAVSIGPGSFTGVRIAVTLAKFIALDTGARIVAVPSFLALAANAPADRMRVATIFDAKRRGLFASLFERVSRAPDVSPGLLHDFNETFGPAMVEHEALIARLPASTYILGHGVAKSREALAAYDLAPPDLWDIRPSVVARLGLELAAAGQWADPLRLEPRYIRSAEADEIWDRKNKKM